MKKTAQTFKRDFSAETENGFSHSVYTTGYTGKSVEMLPSLAGFLDAAVIDIRFSPKSRSAVWTKDYLSLLMKNRYRHVPLLGNRTYKESKINIQNLEVGIKTILNFRSNLILMCGCEKLAECHRLVVWKSFEEREFYATKSKIGKSPNRLCFLNPPIIFREKLK